MCNIGPAEIARRRQAGHAGALASIGLLAVLVVADAPAPARLALALPVALAASGYLQAWLKFCVGFGSRGIFNFGALGQAEQVVDDASRARDRSKSRRIGLASLAIGVAVGVAAALLPL